MQVWLLSKTHSQSKLFQDKNSFQQNWELNLQQFLNCLLLFQNRHRGKRVKQNSRLLKNGVGQHFPH